MSGALALDAADAACATGSTAKASAARPAARAAGGKVRAALAVLPLRVRAYTRAADELAAATKATSRLDDAQRTAVNDVVTAGRAEAAAADAFRVAGKTAWPTYDALDEVQSAWLDRASAGFYRDQQEAANGYAAMTADDRADLTRARTLLRRVDEARRPVTEREQVALRNADAALAPLRTAR